MPYYADESDACPYCETAADDASRSAEPASERESEPEPATAESEFEPAPSEPEPEPGSREEPTTTAQASESTGAGTSLLKRISNTVRAVLTGR